MYSMKKNMKKHGLESRLLCTPALSVGTSDFLCLPVLKTPQQELPARSGRKVGQGCVSVCVPLSLLG